MTNFKNPDKTANYNLMHGTSFAYGTYYQGKDHHHWTSYGWSSQYGCYVYYDPYVSANYYWSEPHQCYYPTSYASTVAPTQYTPPANYGNSYNATAPTPAPAHASAGHGMPEPPQE